ncbi:MAG: hypothetical protein Pyrs2KO_13960 [Pyruvatibacter sp.]
MSLVWRANLKSVEKLVLMKLADHANDDGGNAWPAVELMAAECGCSERSVQRYLRALEERGLITMTRNGGGRHQTNCYQVELDALWTIRLPTRNEREAARIEKLAPGKGDSVAGLSADQPPPNGDSVSGFEGETVTGETQNPDTGVTLTILNHPYPFTSEFVEGLTLNVRRDVAEADARIWRTACAAVAAMPAFGATRWQSWWGKSGLVRRDGDVWIVRAANRFNASRLRQDFEPHLRWVLRELTRADAVLRIEVADTNQRMGDQRAVSQTMRRAGE